MPTPFSQSLRSLDIDAAHRSAFAFGGTAVLLGAWLFWFMHVRITLHQTSDSGRIEVAEAAKPLNAAINGRISATRLVLGKNVNQGDVLVELDSETEQRQLAEELTRVAIVEPQLEALREQVSAEQDALSSQRLAMRAGIDERRAKQEEAAIDSRLASEEDRRAQRLQGNGLISTRDLLRAQSEAQRKLAAIDAIGHDVQRLWGEGQSRANEGLAHIAQLRLHVAELEGKRRTSLATIDVLRTEIAKRQLRAPADGTIGEVAPEHQIGSFVAAGDRLGSLIPKGHLIAVADFVPENALGRIRRGQEGRMRLEGFPWTQFGTVPVTVRNVASVAHNGRIRVELDLVPNGNPRIPLEHGLPGAVEIDVETSTPARIALRFAGTRLGASVQKGDGP
ncbi:HlyD family efflux transporter periplasmic adaptor subunit [Pendulispora brunnea]|uniref:HlyD family efflux transporter periplasmic adaptor subunit n=1 Tax=Pendulispora brunnea TaxID=2905690 RepID=A0ABZ2KJ81_9BACT